MTRERTRLFVIADPTASHQVAMVKALLIAKLADCEIHAFLSVYRDIDESEGYASRSDFKHGIMRDAKQWLSEQLQPCRIAGVPVSHKIVWNSRWHEAALHAIAKSGCDLVIKSSFHHSKSRRFYSSTSDYNLMRHCSCPLLCTQQARNWRSTQVLACVDRGSADPGHARLNDVVIRDARALANIVGMDLHIAAACTDSIDGENLPIKSHGHSVSPQQLGELYGIDESCIHLRKGETVETLKGICDELDPSIVIMGTLSRTGVSGKLIGNTADKLLDMVEADLLTVN